MPGPGDPDGRGKAFITITLPDELCYRITVSGIALPATAAHIHQGVAGQAGGVVVTLGAPSAAGKSVGCVPNVDTTLLKDIVRNPQNYYVNVHNGEFSAGAVRGQLA